MAAAASADVPDEEEEAVEVPRRRPGNDNDKKVRQDDLNVF